MNVHSDQSSNSLASTGKRQAIIEAALAVFAEHGFAGAAVPPIAIRAGVGVGTIYRYFADKEALVNEAFRHAKGELRQALLTGLASDLPPRALFEEFWRRLVDFVRDRPLLFHFLEMQDHLGYLDARSKQIEIEVLAPIVAALTRHRRTGVLRTRMHTAPLIAMVWGGVVGMFKYERAGYFKLTQEDLDAARDATWHALTSQAPEEALLTTTAEAGRGG